MDTFPPFAKILVIGEIAVLTVYPATPTIVGIGEIMIPIGLLASFVEVFLAFW